MATTSTEQVRRDPRYRGGRLLSALAVLGLSVAAWQGWVSWWADDAQAPAAAGWFHLGAGLTLAAAVVLGSVRLGVLLPAVVATVVVCATAAWTLKDTGGPFWMVGVLTVGVIAVMVTGLVGALVVLLRARADLRREVDAPPSKAQRERG
ncbi:hypothetical protein [Kineococcus radiotolerans]|uniref:Uncharacterized protein n=1 Tax=Kineococcus radiotolerans (strain ATCC BAA-149 / DSM 14245 / SRS30216) TaxID=266940 RepID=A6WAU9_KINRD|nr:hypothetical protein [Kineococcus radiotolerans]ABS03938.1 hypothetical protein Krad_2462 [Kineococcus radiotolerans SRS30216 = ATCC BAA-149]